MQGRQGSTSNRKRVAGQCLWRALKAIVKVPMKKTTPWRSSIAKLLWFLPTFEPEVLLVNTAKVGLVRGLQFRFQRNWGEDGTRKDGNVAGKSPCKAAKLVATHYAVCHQTTAWQALLKGFERYWKVFQSWIMIFKLCKDVYRCLTCGQEHQTLICRLRVFGNQSAWVVNIRRQSPVSGCSGRHVAWVASGVQISPKMWDDLRALMRCDLWSASDNSRVERLNFSMLPFQQRRTSPGRFTLFPRVSTMENTLTCQTLCS